MTRAIQRTDCSHAVGSTCLASTTVYIAVYGVIQIFISQIPNFGELWWLSYVAAVMSFTYSFLGLGLGIAKASRKCKEMILDREMLTERLLTFKGNLNLLIV